MKTIFVGNLSADVTADTLHALFESYGEILGIDLAAGQDFGYARMADDSEAYRAVTALNGQLCGGQPLSIKIAEAYSSRHHRAPRTGWLEPMVSRGDPKSKETTETGAHGDHGGKKNSKTRSELLLLTR